MKPKIRPLQITGYYDKVILTDPLGISQPVMLSRGAVLLISLMDGSRSLEDIAVEFERITGYEMSPSEVFNFVKKLNDWYLLDNDRFYEKYSALVEEFLSLKVRPLAFAGESYPKDKDELLDMVSPAKRMENLIIAKPKGVMLPHIDPRRGWDVYLEGLRAIYRTDADIMLIFGIAHSYISQPVNALSMHLDTPLGMVETDIELLEDLSHDLDFDLFSDPLSFKNEHSIEFPVVFIKSLLHERKFKVLPFIFLTETLEDYRLIDEFVRVLRHKLKDKNILVVASVDLSHVGRRFGDEGVNRFEMSQHDKIFLDYLSDGNADGILTLYRMYNNPTSIDAFPAVYAMLRFFEGEVSGKVLKYKVSYEEDTDSAVSFASAVLY